MDSLNINFPIESIAKALVDYIQPAIMDEIEKSILKALDEDTLHTKTETARKLRISVQSLDKYTEEEKIEAVYIDSKKPRYKKSEIERFLKALPTIKYKHKNIVKY